MSDDLLSKLDTAYCCNCSDEIQSTCKGERCYQKEQIVAEHDNQMREEGAKVERDRVLNKITKYIDEMYPVPGPEGDYLYPSRKGRREVYDQMRGLIDSLQATPSKQEPE